MAVTGLTTEKAYIKGNPVHVTGFNGLSQVPCIQPLAAWCWTMADPMDTGFSHSPSLDSVLHGKYSAEEMLDVQRQTADVSAYARTAHNGLLQKRLDLCWIIPNVPLPPPPPTSQGTEQFHTAVVTVWQGKGGWTSHPSEQNEMHIRPLLLPVQVKDHNTVSWKCKSNRKFCCFLGKNMTVLTVLW